MLFRGIRPGAIEVFDIRNLHLSYVIDVLRSAYQSVFRLLRFSIWGDVPL